MTGTGLLDYPRVIETLADPATSFWLRDLLVSASERDPVQVSAELCEARQLVDGYLSELLQTVGPLPLGEHRSTAV